MSKLDTLEVAPDTLEGELHILEVTGLHSLEAAGVDTWWAGGLAVFLKCHTAY
jgi:hypothetical protein